MWTCISVWSTCISVCHTQPRPPFSLTLTFFVSHWYDFSLLLHTFSLFPTSTGMVSYVWQKSFTSQRKPQTTSHVPVIEVELIAKHLSPLCFWYSVINDGQPLRACTTFLEQKEADYYSPSLWLTLSLSLCLYWYSIGTLLLLVL